MFESFQRHKQFLLLEWNLKKKGKFLRWANTEGYLNQKKKKVLLVIVKIYSDFNLRILTQL